MIRRLLVTHTWAPLSFQAIHVDSQSKAAIGLSSFETACSVRPAIKTSQLRPASSLLAWIHACWMPAGALAAYLVFAPVTASCDDAGEPDEESTSNEHTAKFTIFSDKARRAAAEVCAFTPTCSCLLALTSWKATVLTAHLKHDTMCYE